MTANIWRLAALGTALTLAVSAANRPTPLADTKSRQAGGLKIFYREAGFPARPAIVLWRGYPSALHPLRNPIPKLATRYHMIFPALPGIGYSDDAPAARFAYTPAQLTGIMGKLSTGIGVEKYSLDAFDYGSPISFPQIVKPPEKIQSINSPHGNAYEAGLSPFGAEYLVPYWNGRNPESEKRSRELFTCGFTKLPHSNGFRNPDRVSPDAYTLAQMNSDRPGNQDIQHALLYDYLTNARKDPRWHQALRRVKPPALAAWGKSDPIFIPAGAGPFKTHAPKAEHPFLNSGHVALEEDLDQIASLFWPRAFASGPPRRKTTCNESRP